MRSLHVHVTLSFQNLQGFIKLTLELARKRLLPRKGEWQHHTTKSSLAETSATTQLKDGLDVERTAKPRAKLPDLYRGRTNNPAVNVFAGIIPCRMLARGPTCNQQACSATSLFESAGHGFTGLEKPHEPQQPRHVADTTAVDRRAQCK